MSYWHSVSAAEEINLCNMHTYLVHQVPQSRCCAQVINLRTLKPIDRDTIVKSIKKTHRMVSAEEGWPQCGIGAELIAIAVEECFDDLDAPPERVTGAEVPMPYAANLEAAALPQVRKSVNTLKTVLV